MFVKNRNLTITKRACKEKLILVLILNPFSFAEACESSVICGKRGFCSNDRLGFCVYCDEIKGFCQDQKNITGFGIQECQEICEGNQAS